MLKNKIFGHIDTSFIDFQGRYSIILYFTGCQLHCPYCFNKQLVFGDPKYSIEDVWKNYWYILETLPNIGIVLTGGEPTINSQCFNVVKHFEHRLIALHTNGLYLRSTIKDRIDSVVLGLKGPNDLPKHISYDDYILKFRAACEFYKNSVYKEIRVVDIPEYRNYYDKALEKVNGYKIKFVEDARNES